MAVAAKQLDKDGSKSVPIRKLRTKLKPLVEEVRKHGNVVPIHKKIQGISNPLDRALAVELHKQFDVETAEAEPAAASSPEAEDDSALLQAALAHGCPVGYTDLVKTEGYTEVDTPDGKIRAPKRVDNVNGYDYVGSHMCWVGITSDTPKGKQAWADARVRYERRSKKSREKRAKLGKLRPHHKLIGEYKPPPSCDTHDLGNYDWRSGSFLLPDVVRYNGKVVGRSTDWFVRHPTGMLNGDDMPLGCGRFGYTNEVNRRSLEYAESLHAQDMENRWVAFMKSHSPEEWANVKESMAHDPRARESFTQEELKCAILDSLCKLADLGTTKSAKVAEYFGVGYVGAIGDIRVPLERDVRHSQREVVLHDFETWCYVTEQELENQLPFSTGLERTLAERDVADGKVQVDTKPPAPVEESSPVASRNDESGEEADWIVDKAGQVVPSASRSSVLLKGSDWVQEIYIPSLQITLDLEDKYDMIALGVIIRKYESLTSDLRGRLTRARMHHNMAVDADDLPWEDVAEDVRNWPNGQTTVVQSVDKPAANEAVVKPSHVSSGFLKMNSIAKDLEKDIPKRAAEKAEKRAADDRSDKFNRWLRRELALAEWRGLQWTRQTRRVLLDPHLLEVKAVYDQLKLAYELRGFIFEPKDLWQKARHLTDWHKFCVYSDRHRKQQRSVSQAEVAVHYDRHVAAGRGLKREESERILSQVLGSYNREVATLREWASQDRMSLEDIRASCVAKLYASKRRDEPHRLRNPWLERLNGLVESIKGYFIRPKLAEVPEEVIEAAFEQPEPEVIKEKPPENDTPVVTEWGMVPERSIRNEMEEEKDNVHRIFESEPPTPSLIHTGVQDVVKRVANVEAVLRKSGAFSEKELELHKRQVMNHIEAVAPEPPKLRRSTWNKFLEHSEIRARLRA